MNLFKKISEITKGDSTVIITVRTTKDGRMAVATAFTGELVKDIPPFVLKGTAQELDDNFENEIAEPVETVAGMMSNMAAFKAGAEAAAKKAAQQKKTETKTRKETSPKPTPEQTAAAKEAEEKARRDRKAKALFDEAGKARKDEKFNTALAFYTAAFEETNDTRFRKEIASCIEAVTPETASFFCCDNAADAEAAIKEFLKALPAEDAPAGESVEETIPAAEETTAEETTAEEETENS